MKRENDMKITDLLKKESVLLEGHATDKKDALHTLVGLMAKQGNVADVETYEACVLKREEEGSTGVGEGVAIPHAKTPHRTVRTTSIWTY